MTEGGFVSVHVDSIDPEMFAQLHRAGTRSTSPAIVQGVDNLLALGKPPEQDDQLYHLHRAPGARGRHPTMRWWFEEKGLRTCLTMFNPAGMGAEWRELEPAGGRDRSRSMPSATGSTMATTR